MALVSIGNLDDQFGDTIEAEFGNETTFLAEGGLRYRLLPRLYIDVGVSYMPLTAEAEVLRSTDPRATLPAEINLDPVMLTGGVSWRF